MGDIVPSFAADTNQIALDVHNPLTTPPNPGVDTNVVKTEAVEVLTDLAASRALTGSDAKATARVADSPSAADTSVKISTEPTPEVTAQLLYGGIADDIAVKYVDGKKQSPSMCSGILSQIISNTKGRNTTKQVLVVRADGKQVNHKELLFLVIRTNDQKITTVQFAKSVSSMGGFVPANKLGDHDQIWFTEEDIDELEVIRRSRRDVSSFKLK